MQYVPVHQTVLKQLLTKLVGWTPFISYEHTALIIVLETYSIAYRQHICLENWSMIQSGMWCTCWQLWKSEPRGKR